MTPEKTVFEVLKILQNLGFSRPKLNSETNYSTAGLSFHSEKSAYQKLVSSTPLNLDCWTSQCSGEVKVTTYLEIGAS